MKHIIPSTYRLLVVSTLYSLRILLYFFVLLLFSLMNFLSESTIRLLNERYILLQNAILQFFTGIWYFIKGICFSIQYSNSQFRKNQLRFFFIILIIYLLIYCLMFIPIKLLLYLFYLLSIKTSIISDNITSIILVCVPNFLLYFLRLFVDDEKYFFLTLKQLEDPVSYNNFIKLSRKKSALLYSNIDNTTSVLIGGYVLWNISFKFFHFIFIFIAIGYNIYFFLYRYDNKMGNYNNSQRNGLSVVVISILTLVFYDSSVLFHFSIIELSFIRLLNKINKNSLFFGTELSILFGIFSILPYFQSFVLNFVHSMVFSFSLINELLFPFFSRIDTKRQQEIITEKRWLFFGFSFPFVMIFSFPLFLFFGYSYAIGAASFLYFHELKHLL